MAYTEDSPRSRVPIATICLMSTSQAPAIRHDARAASTGRLRVAAIGGSGLAIVGVFLTWASLNPVYFEHSLSGWDTNQGKVVLGCSIAAGIASIIRKPFLAAILGACGVGSLLWFVMTFPETAREAVDDAAIVSAPIKLYTAVIEAHEASTGVGVFLAGLGLALVIVSSLASWQLSHSDSNLSDSR